MLMFKSLSTKNVQTIFRVISQNQEYVKTHCNDLNNPFHFACRGWMVKQ